MADAVEHNRLRQDYDIFEMLGQGSSAVVCRGARKSDGLEVALKQVSVPHAEKLAMVQKEYETLRALRHPNVVRALDFVVAGERAVIVLELVPGLDLSTTLRGLERRRFEEAWCQALSRQLFEAVAHLHERHILHRDIKGPNLMVSPDLSALKLLDFNVACRSGGALTTTGTHEYQAPEVLLGEVSSEASDVWSAGLCLHLMMAGRLPRRVEQYSSLGDFANAVATRPVQLRNREEFSEAGHAVLQRCLELDKLARPAAMTLLREPWLSPSRGRSKDRKDAQHYLSNCSTRCDSSSGSISPLLPGLEAFEDVPAASVFRTDAASPPQRLCSPPVHDIA